MVAEGRRDPLAAEVSLVASVAETLKGGIFVTTMGLAKGLCPIHC